VQANIKSQFRIALSQLCLELDELGMAAALLGKQSDHIDKNEIS